MTVTDPYSLRHQKQRSAADADQAEFLAIRNGASPPDAGIYDERVAGAMDDHEHYDEIGATVWQEDDLKYDDAVGMVHEEIERRRETLGSAYPFQIHHGKIEYVPNDNLIYEFLLAICNASTLTEGEYVELPRVFERLSARLIAAYLGDGARFLHTGAPRDKEIGISFKDAMNTVASETSEWEWGPDEGLPDEPKNGDSGCDFVAWPKAPDNRPIGQLFFLGQCACGNDWNTKLNDLTVKKLGKWFNPLSIVDPVRCFTTPHHITDAMLKEASREGGYVFDRARLVSIGHACKKETVEASIKDEMKDLIELVVQN